MIKKLLFLNVLLYFLPIHAQMVDLIGSLGVQGALTNQSSQSVAQGMFAVKRLKVLQDIQDIAMQVKTEYVGYYHSVNKNTIYGNQLSGLNWDLGSIGDNLFYIQLNQIDNQICSYLIHQNISAQSILVNGQSNTLSCIENNTIKYIFD